MAFGALPDRGAVVTLTLTNVACACGKGLGSHWCEKPDLTEVVPVRGYTLEQIEQALFLTMGVVPDWIWDNVKKVLEANDL